MLSYLSCNNKATSYTPDSPAPCFPAGLYSLISLAQGLHISWPFGPASPLAGLPHLPSARSGSSGGEHNALPVEEQRCGLHWGDVQPGGVPFPFPQSGCSVTALGPLGTCGAGLSWAADDSLR